MSNTDTTWIAAVRSDHVSKSNLVKAVQLRVKSGQIIQNQTRPDQVRQDQTRSLSNSKLRPEDLELVKTAGPPTGLSGDLHECVNSALAIVAL